MSALVCVHGLASRNTAGRRLRRTVGAHAELILVLWLLLWCLSSRSFTPSSPFFTSQGKTESNSGVTVSIVNVKDHIASVLVLCGSTAALPLLGPKARLSREAASAMSFSGLACQWLPMCREKMMMLLLLLGSAEVLISLQALKNWVMPGHLLVMYLLTVTQRACSEME